MGVPATHAARAAGLSYQSLLNYQRLHPQFADDMARAVSEGVESRLEVIERATQSQDEAIRLRAACWFLEHTQPAHFARNRIELTGADGSPLAAAVAIYLPKKDGDAPAVEVNQPKLIQDNGRR
jgi:hypothetical protein